MMRITHSWLWCVALAAAPLAAQSVKVYSEFQRLDPRARILAVDKAPRPREILSPGVIRNAYASFHVVVSVPKDAEFRLYVGENPENTFKTTAYRVRWEQRGTALWPDRLAPLAISADGMVADPGPGPPGRTTVVYVMDLWVPASAPVGRVRFELQLNVGDEWIIYPMEIRVLEPVLPAVAEPGAALAPVTASAEATAGATLRSYLCGGGQKEPEGPLTIRRLIRRNARQDAALARSLEATCGREAIATGLLAVLAPDAQVDSWCQAPVFPAGQGAEWYLRVRDYLYRAADRGCAAAPDAKATITVAPVPK